MHIPILSSPFGLNPLLLLLTGFCVGTQSSFFGIGGGWLINPALHILGLPMPYAIGTSLFSVLITGVQGATVYILAGKIDWSGILYLTVISHSLCKRTETATTGVTVLAINHLSLFQSRDSKRGAFPVFTFTTSTEDRSSPLDVRSVILTRYPGTSGEIQ
jgi:hypothetical protein